MNVIVSAKGKNKIVEDARVMKVDAIYIGKTL